MAAEERLVWLRRFGSSLWCLTLGFLVIYSCGFGHCLTSFRLINSSLFCVVLGYVLFTFPLKHFSSFYVVLACVLFTSHYYSFHCLVMFWPVS